jgi:hypothetical protein
MAPEGYKETARQHPRAVPVISETHVLPSSETCAAEVKPITETVSGKQENEKSPKTLTQTVAEKLAPAYNTVSVATNAIASKIQSLAVSTPETVISETHVLPSSVTCAAEDKPITETVSGKQENEKSPKTPTETVAEKLAPAYNTVSIATHAISSKIQSLAISTPEAPGAAGLDPAEEGRAASSVAGPTKVALDQVTSDPSRDPVAAASGDHFCAGEKKWDKGVSVKEYLMHMSGPEEDDRALSQVTLQATSPRKTAGDVSVVDKVRDAVNSLLQVQESSQPTVFHSAKNSSSDITISTDAHEGDLIYFFPFIL